MKKMLLPVLTLLLLCGLVLTVSAAAPGAPVINSQFPDCSVPEGAELTLFSDASSPDGGTLEYQWYSTTVNEMEAIQAVIGAEGESYRVPDFSGTRWFCYAVRNVNSAGKRSDPVYSRLIRVERYEEVTAVSLEIRETPTKVVYTSGECLDLTGLKVRIWTSDGYIDSVNGDKLEITKNPLITVGEQKIKVAYGDVFDFFIVTVEEPEPAYRIEIQQEPDKLVYTSGECLDLTGLKVRVYTPDGYFDSLNGDKLEITKNPLVTVGYQKVAYEDAFEVFIVEVKEAPHTHSFGEWMVTTAPTCTESGIKARECDCGYTERAEIPAAGHAWDEGTVTVEATAEQDGEKTFTCTVCKATKTEVIKAGGIVSEPTEDTDPTENSENTISTGESEASGENQPSGTEPSSGFPWWIVVILVIAIGIGTGTTLFILNKKKK